MCNLTPVSYTHLRAHETSAHLVCRLLLEKNGPCSWENEVKISKKRKLAKNHFLRSYFAYFIFVTFLTQPQIEA